MKNNDKYIKIGIVFTCTYLIINGFDSTSSVINFIKGMCAGAGIFLMLFSIYTKNHDISKFKNFKRKLFHLKCEK